MTQNGTMPNGYCTNINTGEETIDHSQAILTEHAVSHLYSVPARSATFQLKTQQNPEHSHGRSSQTHSNRAHSNQTHSNQTHSNQTHSNQTHHIQNQQHSPQFQLVTFPNDADLQNLPLDGRNFQVFSLSADQLQSEATKAQIQSLLDLEPENELTPTKFQQNPDFQDEFQKFEKTTDFSQPIFENHQESGNKSLKMSQTIENNDNSENPKQTTPTQPQPQQPLLVNAKQYHRILIRRDQREKLIKLGRIPKHRKKYLHESRHRHAMMRNRSEGGRFNRGSTKTKLQALKNCEERRNLKEQKKKLEDENKLSQNNSQNKEKLDSNDNRISGENSSTI